MKKILVVSMMASVALIAGEYGYRDFLTDYAKTKTAFGFVSFDEKQPLRVVICQVIILC